MQRHALRLIEEQGYEATTVEQIAAAAEVSPSTFFRYFPTKEDAVMYDALDPCFFRAFAGQPAGMTTLQALAGAMKTVIRDMPADEIDNQRARARLALRVPALRTKMLEQLLETTRPFQEAVARRAGRKPDDMAVRVFVGAVLGASLLTMLADPAWADGDVYGQFEAVLGQLESRLGELGAGLPL
jgi:AcrR family transcriptional regulator